MITNIILGAILFMVSCSHTEETQSPMKFESLYSEANKIAALKQYKDAIYYMTENYELKQLSITGELLMSQQIHIPYNPEYKRILFWLNETQLYIAMDSLFFHFLDFQLTAIDTLSDMFSYYAEYNISEQILYYNNDDKPKNRRLITAFNTKDKSKEIIRRPHLEEKILNFDYHASSVMLKRYKDLLLVIDNAENFISVYNTHDKKWQSYMNLNEDLEANSLDSLKWFFDYSYRDIPLGGTIPIIQAAVIVNDDLYLKFIDFTTFNFSKRRYILKYNLIQLVNSEQQKIKKDYFEFKKMGKFLAIINQTYYLSYNNEIKRVIF